MSMWTRQEESWNQTKQSLPNRTTFGPVWTMTSGSRSKLSLKIWSSMTTQRKTISMWPHWLNFKSETLFWEWSFPLLQPWQSKSAKFRLHAMLKVQLSQCKQQMIKTRESQQPPQQTMNSNNSSPILIGDSEPSQPATCKSESTMSGSAMMMSKKVSLT